MMPSSSSASSLFKCQSLPSAPQSTMNPPQSNQPIPINTNSANPTTTTIGGGIDSILPVSLVNMLQQQHHPHHPLHSSCSPSRQTEMPSKSFVCEICGKAFRFRSNLAEHRSVHTAVKPFVCKFCGKSSRLKGNLTKHILKHHKTEQRDYIGTDDYIIKKGKKSVKDPAAIEFLERSMIVLNNNISASSTAARNHVNGIEKQQDSADGAADCIINPGILLSFGLDSASLDLKTESMSEGSDNGGSGNSNGQFDFSLFSTMTDSGGTNVKGAGHLGGMEESEEGDEEEEEEQQPAEEDDEMDPEQQQPQLQRNGESSAMEMATIPNGRTMMMMGEGEQGEDEAMTTASIDGGAATALAAATAACQALFGQIAKGGGGGGGKDNEHEEEDGEHEEAAATAGQEMLLLLAASFGQQQQQQQQLKLQLNGGEKAMEQCDQFISNGERSQSTAQYIYNSAINNCIGSTSASDGGGGRAAQGGVTRLAPTQCQQCGKHFRKPRDLNAHLSTAHKSPAATPQVQSGAQTSNSVTVPSGHSIANSVDPLELSSGNSNTNNNSEMIRQELRLLRLAVKELKDGAASVEGRQTTTTTAKIEQMLGQLDSRVCRLEKQLEMALNSIYTLVQLQTTINNNVSKLSRALLNNNQQQQQQQ